MSLSTPTPAQKASQNLGSRAASVTYLPSLVSYVL